MICYKCKEEKTSFVCICRDCLEYIEIENSYDAVRQVIQGLEAFIEELKEEMK